MSKRLRIITAVVGFGSLFVFWYFPNLGAAIALFIALWANNVSERGNA